MTKIIDTPWSVHGKVKALRKAGVETVIRYLNHQNSTRLPEKCITAGEAAALRKEGLGLILTFQQRQDRAGDFSKAAGERAALRAFALCRDVVGQPAGRPIHFSVDCDLKTEADLGAVASFFAAVNATLAALAQGGAGYPVGVYGSGTVCRHLERKRLASFFWLAQSTDWQGYDSFIRSGDWHLKQGPQTQIGRIPADANESNPARPDFGAFIPSPP